MMAGRGEGISRKGESVAKVQSLQTTGYLWRPVRCTRSQSAYKDIAERKAERQVDRPNSILKSLVLNNVNG